MGRSAVPAGRYYERYQGHPMPLLSRVHDEMRRVEGEGNDGAKAEQDGGERPTIFLAGDSTLDNKHWLFPYYDQSAACFLGDVKRKTFTATAVNGFDRVLQPPAMVQDVTFWLNHELAERDSKYFALNTSVEASTLTERVGGCQLCCVPTCGHLLPQDEYIRDNITEKDVLLVSMGGNDVALAPSIFTALFMFLMMITPWFLLFPCHPAIMYFLYLFRVNGVRYIKKVTSVTMPHKIGVCMLYNLDEANVSSWANATLGCLCYSCFPSMLQYRINLIYRYGISRIKLRGTTIVPIRLCEALDGKDTQDYCERVEPSIIGGRKMARLILEKLKL